MPYEAQLHAIAPEDLSLLVACYQPMGFLTRNSQEPIDPVQRREWLAACVPLLERLGDRAPAHLRAWMQQLGQPAPAPSVRPGPHEEPDLDFQLRHLLMQFAAELLSKGPRTLASARYAFRHDAVLWAYFRRNFDGRLLVPSTAAVHWPDLTHTFATASIPYVHFGHIYVWRSAEEVHAFFSQGQAHLTPPTPEQVIENKEALGLWYSPKDALEQARREIEEARESWATQVELLRTAARLGAAYISVCQDTTEYE